MCMYIYMYYVLYQKMIEIHMVMKSLNAHTVYMYVYMYCTESGGFIYTCYNFQICGPHSEGRSSCGCEEQEGEFPTLAGCQW